MCLACLWLCVVIMTGCRGTPGIQKPEPVKDAACNAGLMGVAGLGVLSSVLLLVNLWDGRGWME